MNVEQARIFIWNKEDNQLVRYTKDGSQQCFPANSGIAGSVLAKGEYENVTNSYDHLLFNGNIDIDTKLPVIVWPIKHPYERREMLGVFEVVNVRGIQGMAHSSKAKINIFDFESLDFFSKQLAQAIVNHSQSGQQWDSETLSNVGTNRPNSRNHLSIPSKRITSFQDIGNQTSEIKPEKNLQEKNIEDDLQVLSEQN